MRTFLRLGLFYGAIVLATLLAAEFLVLPAIGKLPRETLLMRFAATPGSVIDGQTINAIGFTGSDISHPKPEGTTRVLVLGSSTMFNRHLGERLQAALQARSDRPIELLNASLRSHTSRSDLLKYRLLQQYEWDYLVYYNGINDLWANHVPPEHYQHDYSHISGWYREGRLINHSLVLRYAYLAVRPLMEMLDAWLGTNRYPHTKIIFPNKGSMNLANFTSIRDFESNLQDIIAIARQHHTKVLLSTFAYAIPENYSRKAFMANELGFVNPDNYDKRDISNWGNPAYLREGLDKTNEIIRAIGQQPGITLLDSQQLFGESTHLFGDVCHFNDDGVDAFIQAVVATFEQEQWLN